MYFGGVDRPSAVQCLIKGGAKNVIVSFAYLPSRPVKKLLMDNNFNLLLDSGAFTMWRTGKQIDIDKYCNYITDHPEYAEYFVLDHPEDQVKTIENQEYMESEGLTPIPIFSYGSDWAYLDKLAKHYKRIGLGGCVQRGSVNIIAWLTEVYRRYPNIKYHLLGITKWHIIKRFPLDSIDSTSWITRWRLREKNHVSLDRMVEQTFRVERSLMMCRDGGGLQLALF